MNTPTRAKSKNRVNPNRACAQCGMALSSPREYHPYAACVLMEHYRDGNKVRMVLESMRDYFAEGGTLDDISTRRHPSS